MNHSTLPKKIKIYFTLISVGAFSLIVQYTNMKSADKEMNLLLQESKNVQKHINDPQFSKSGRDFLIEHKKLIFNVLAKKVLASSCVEVNSYDNTMPTGRYILYRNGNINSPEYYDCTTSQGKVTKQTYIQKVNLSVSQGPKATSTFKTVTMNKSGTGLYRTDIPGTSGLPKIIKLLSSKQCKANTDYGFDTNGIWVKNGCRATFNVPVIVPTKDRYIATGKTPPAPIVGSFTFVKTSNQLQIKGWACEKDKSKPIKVQIYAGGPAGIGKLLTSATAQNDSESAVNEKCGTAESANHRFLSLLSLNSLSKHKGKELFVYGLGSDNNGTINGELDTGLSKTFTGSNQCGTTTCSMEDPRDKNDGNRFMIRNDAASVKQRCHELGYTAGTTVDTYSRAEWCTYSNARTKYWNGSKWILGSCVDGNVSSARCYNGIP